MLEELAKADKIEQMNQNRRRMKLHNHKKKVEELWTLKKEKILEEKRRREEERLLERQLREEEEALIEQQKQLLIQKHLPYIDGFCSTELTNIARNGSKHVNQKPNRFMGNDIFGVSMDRIEEWERQKENRRYN
jgi:hypothetical protein